MKHVEILAAILWPILQREELIAIHHSDTFSSLHFSSGLNGLEGQVCNWSHW
jgi:hypothetical protein